MASVPTFEDHDKQSVKYSTCYMCACRCGIKVTVEDKKIRYIEGNRAHPVNKGVLCAKGNAGIMKQNSPAKLTTPMLRKKGSTRGDGEYEAISMDEALDILTARLKHIRNTDPKKLAYFTGRDQMQALTGLWASQFGTINWASHGGFCSVNMAAAGLYTTGFAFWEFGDPDWDNTKYFMMWGVADDHASNPIKIGLEKLKSRGAKFVSINPTRTGYQAIADEWIGITPGTDMQFALSMVHVLLKHEQFDWEFLIRYTNSAYLTVNTPGQKGDGLFLRDDEGNPLVWDMEKEQAVNGKLPDINPALFYEGEVNGTPVRSAMGIFAETYLDEKYSPERSAEITGIPAETIERLALEMAHVAFKESIEIKQEWTDYAGRKHDTFIGRPVSMHAMRGVSAHSNGFQACRAIHFIQILLGSVDCPGGHLAKPPYPKPIAPPIKPCKTTKPNTPLSSPPLGFPTCPEDLVVDDDGKPLRIDKAFSWDAPLSNHGLMHMVITNAYNGDPYPIDTLMMFMANMSWNSTMNTSEVRKMLSARDENGEHKIPFIVVSDAYHSEITNFADLVIPDTTYLERYDTISMLDRPISEPHAAGDAIRQPIVKAERDVMSWQEVQIEIGSRLGFPVFVDENGERKYSGYKDFVTNWQPTEGIGLLAGWRLDEDGKETHLRGKPNPKQWQRYKENGAFLEVPFSPEKRYYRHANKDYLEWAKSNGWIGSSDQIVMELYSETLQKFNLAGQGLYDGPMPTEQHHKDRLKKYFTPLPEFYTPLEQTRIDEAEYPFHAINQRPMFMYHSWDSQNAWLRQIISQNFLYMNREQAQSMGIEDKTWVWVESHNGKIRVQVKHMEGCVKNTVWTWNAIAKQSGAWGLKKGTNEAKDAFLMNHLISELLPKRGDALDNVTNSDPITGQAAWYDLRVKIYPVENGETGAYPQFPDMQKAPEMDSSPDILRYNAHEHPVRIHRSMRDVLTY
ncbi:formate dehydrogenase [Leucothrix sargassi]|nr:formate dehydrogenase [Leucothrix sargassi]